MIRQVDYQDVSESVSFYAKRQAVLPDIKWPQS